MKKSLILIIPALILTSFVKGQDSSHFSGDERKCPYLHPELRSKAKSASTAPPFVIDDFENELITTKQWSNLMDSGTLHSSIETTDSCKEGKKGAKITFTGTRGNGSWTNLYCKTSVPKDKTKVTFWAKAPRQTKVQVKVNQGETHKDMEMYGKTIFLNTEWKKYEISFNEMTELIFSHLQYDGKSPTNKVNTSEVFGVGFAESDLPAVLYIDQLQFE